MIGTAYPGQDLGFDSPAATTDPQWLQWLRRLRRKRADVQSKTAGPPQEGLYQIKHVDCREQAAMLNTLIGPPSGSTAAQPVFWYATPAQPETGSRIAVNGTICYVEQERPMASTAWQKQTIDLYRLAEVAFRAAEEESFEDGVESEFARQLVSLVKRFGNSIVDVISTRIAFQQVSGEVASMALRTLGEINHPFSRSGRLRLLKEMLSSSSLWVRDGAALALAWMDDPAAVPDVEKAIERETIEELRRDMTGILEHLKRAR